MLADLGLPQDALLLALVGFNLGVEGGQLAIVSAFLPLAYYLRDTLFYRRVVLLAGSIMIMLLASVWLIERVCLLVNYWDFKPLNFTTIAPYDSWLCQVIAHTPLLRHCRLKHQSARC